MEGRLVPDNIYWYFRNILKVLSRNTRYGIIINRQNTQDNFEAHHLEYFRAIFFYRTLTLTQVDYMGKNPLPFNIIMIEWL